MGTNKEKFQEEKIKMVGQITYYSYIGTILTKLTGNWKRKFLCNSGCKKDTHIIR